MSANLELIQSMQCFKKRSVLKKKKNFSHLPSSNSANWLLFWMFWICVEGHCTIREPGVRTADDMLRAAPSSPEGQRGPWQNTRHWLACVAGWLPEGKGPLIQPVVRASSCILNLIQAAVDSSSEMNSLAAYVETEGAVTKTTAWSTRVAMETCKFTRRMIVLRE